MDFFNVNYMAASLNPYSQGSSYPPLAMLIAYVFARIIPGTGTGAPVIQRDADMFGKICLYVLYAVCLAVLAAAACRGIWVQLRKDAESGPLTTKLSGVRKITGIFSKIALLGAVSLSIVLAAPVIYAFDRGNYLIICTLFLALFCLYYDKNDYAAASFLAIAACLKIYPVVLFYVFFRTRKWKPMFLGLFIGGGFTAASAALFNGSLFWNLRQFVQNVLLFSGGQGPNHSYYYRYGVGLRNIFGTLSIIFRGYVSDYLHIAKLSLVTGGALLAVVIIMCILDKRPWRQILYLSFFMILFPSPSFYYNLAYLVGPILLFLLKEKSEKLDWLYLWGLALLMTPKSYYYFLAHFTEGDGWVGVDCLINPLIMCGLLLVSFIELIHIRKNSKESIGQADEKDLVNA